MHTEHGVGHARVVPSRQACSARVRVQKWLTCPAQCLAALSAGAQTPAGRSRLQPHGSPWQPLATLCPSPSVAPQAPGMDPFRPDQRTPVPNFFLAGSYTKQDYIDRWAGRPC